MKYVFACFLMLMLFGLSAQGADDKAPSVTAVKKIGLEEFDNLRVKTNSVVLDVRTRAEFENGHVPGATNIDINSSHFAERISALEKRKTYLVNCAAGVRSAKACKQLDALGFTNVYDLSVGYNGWSKAGKPVEK